MTKQELLKQADYTFQRGNHTLAKKMLTDYLSSHPKDEAGWMLMARIETDKDARIRCYERALKINSSNSEARIALTRLKSISLTLPRPEHITATFRASKPKPYRSLMRTGAVVAVIIFLFATSTLVIARNNPESALAKLLVISPPTLIAESPLADDVAADTRAQVNAEYPQYTALVDTLISYAVQNAANGMVDAPERPGAEIIVSDQAGMEARTAFTKAIPQPGALTSATITEQQITSWLALEMKNNPDLPLSDIQVYLRDGKIQVWGMVNGSEDSTSALIVGTANIDGNQQPYFELESMQIGQQVVPDLMLSQVESWLNQLITEQINSQVPGLELMNVNVTNGLITVSGMR